MFENLTGDARQVITESLEFTRTTKSPRTDVCHLLYGLAAVDSRTRNILEDVGITKELLCSVIEIEHTPASLIPEILFTDNAKNILTLAQSISKAMKLNEVYTGHFLLAIIDCNDKFATNIFARKSVELSSFRNNVAQTVMEAADVNGSEARPKAGVTHDDQVIFLIELAKENQTWRKDLQLLMKALSVSSEEIDKRMKGSAN